MESGGSYYQDMDRLAAMEKGMRTWADWVDKNIDVTKTRVFFQAISPTHYKLVSLSFSLSFSFYICLYCFAPLLNAGSKHQRLFPMLAFSLLSSLGFSLDLMLDILHIFLGSITILALLILI